MLQDRKSPRAAGDEQFQVSAFFSLQERRPRILKRDDTFAVIDPNGDLLSGFGSSDGIYYRDTRYLSHYELLIGGVRPILLSSSLTDDSSMLVSDLANPDIFAEQKLVLRHDSIHIRRSKFLQDGVCHERVVVRNFADVVIALPIEFRFQADFADIFEVRGLERPRRGAFLDPVLDGGSVVLSYNGLDGRRLTTTLILDPVPDTLEGNHAIFILPCAPREHRIIFVTMSCVGIPPPPPRENYLRSLVAIRRQNRAERPRSATIDSSNEIFNETIRRAQCDIEMLTSHTPHGPYVYAGIPWPGRRSSRPSIVPAGRCGAFGAHHTHARPFRAPPSE